MARSYFRQFFLAELTALGATVAVHHCEKAGMILLKKTLICNELKMVCQTFSILNLLTLSS